MNRRFRALGSSVLNLVNRPLGKRRFKAAVRSASGPLRIELGAWTIQRSGWISTDIHWRGSTYLDGTRPWPVDDESTEYIYADNVIEHITLEQNRRLFEYAFRALMPGGRIRLVTPDIGALAAIYVAGDEAACLLKNELLAEGYSISHQVDVLRFAFHDDGHDKGYLWDTAALQSELESAGFRHVTTHAAGESQDPNLRGLEVRVGTPVADICVIAEAVKPEV